MMLKEKYCNALGVLPNVIKLRVSSKLWGAITFCYYTKTIESTNFFTDHFLEFVL